MRSDPLPNYSRLHSLRIPIRNAVELEQGREITLRRRRIEPKKGLSAFSSPRASFQGDRYLSELAEYDQLEVHVFHFFRFFYAVGHDFDRIGILIHPANGRHTICHQLGSWLATVSHPGAPGDIPWKCNLDLFWANPGNRSAGGSSRQRRGPVICYDCAQQIRALPNSEAGYPLGRSHSSQLSRWWHWAPSPSSMR